MTQVIGTLTGALTRAVSTARVGFASSVVFATVGTGITSLVLLPALDIVFDVVLGSDLRAPDLTRIAYGAALVAIATSVCSGVVARVASDRDLGIFLEVHLRRRVDPAYWIGVAAVPSAFASLTGGVVILGVFIISESHDPGMLGLVGVLGMCSIVLGTLLGIGAAGIGVVLPDPYLGATLVSTFLPLLAGVVVPVEFYPGWLRFLGTLVPMTSTLTVLRGTGAGIGRDVMVALAWAVLGVLIAARAAGLLRKGVRRDII